MVEGRRPPRNTGVGPSGNPQLGCIVAHVLGARDGVPPFVSNPGNDFTSRFVGSGWLPRSTVPFRGMDVGLLRQDASDSYLQQRQSLLQHIDSNVDAGSHSWDHFQQQAVDILTSRRVAEAFDIQRESLAVQRMYGIGQHSNRDNMGELTLTARRLVEAGVRFVTVGRNSWDHHNNIFPQLRSRLPVFDSAFAGVVSDLRQRGMLDETLVIYMTEYGRTPRVNSQAGRDHWPAAFSVAFAGAGIRPGQVIGCTDRNGDQVRDNPITPEQIAATILHLVGIDPQHIVHRRDGRPTTLAEESEPIHSLLL